MTDYGVPIIDIAPLVSGLGSRDAVAQKIGAACQDAGFFYIVGHGIAPSLQERLESLSRSFFALPTSAKMTIDMPKAGRAWRGYFPVGSELTSGKPDLKEGIYFGSELSPQHPDVKAGLPLHGANLFPQHLPDLKPVVLQYIHDMTNLGHALMGGIALSLGLEESYFRDRYTADPFVLFRIFNYPPSHTSTPTQPEWGVGEHTDYGVLTILKQDETGGLEVKSKRGWVSAPPVPGSFICNIGDMLELMTSGVYSSTPHRVRNTSGRARLSWPFFFDPNFHAHVKRISLTQTATNSPEKVERWDREDVHAFNGTYGDYLLRKVSKVFPELQKQSF